MIPQSEPAKAKNKLAMLQATPTKSYTTSSGLKAPSFQFTFRREFSLDLSPEAKKLMSEKREEALKVREQMASSGEGQESAEEVVRRKIATPKGMKGRFSQAHLENFAKMDSIAGHASAFRADADKLKMATTPKQIKSLPQTQEPNITGTKSLKRSPSKAGLDDAEQTSARQAPRSIPKSITFIQHAQVPSSATATRVEDAIHNQSPSPAKRVKRDQCENVATIRPPVVSSDKSVPATPPRKSANLAHLTTPTQSSLARASAGKSIKSTKLPTPAIAAVQTHTQQCDQPPASSKPSTKIPALCSSPAKSDLRPDKANLMATSSVPDSTPFLSRSPAKAPLFPQTFVDGPSTAFTALLARSPARPISSSVSVSGTIEARTQVAVDKTPLLARSPLKASAVTADEIGIATTNAPTVPFLARSPSKLPISGSAPSFSTTPNKLLDRFQLLRKSPMKSILRSPQRLYSDDPAKVAAGTHLATPPKHVFGLASKGQPVTPKPAPATAPVQKHVEFTSSTKARDTKDRTSSSNTPNKSPTPPVRFGRSVAMSAEPELTSYPALPVLELSPSPQKRRQTAAPGDFTFRVGDGIIFAPSPSAPTSALSSKRPSTIRHVSSDQALPPPPSTGSKKRKFDFENELGKGGAEGDDVQDKENTPAAASLQEDGSVSRPAKRVKPNTPQPSPTKAAVTRPATLGVKPAKGAKEVKKRSALISQARLAALSQPKRRG